jgi:hypothetical protein
MQKVNLAHYTEASLADVAVEVSTALTQLAGMFVGLTARSSGPGNRYEAGLEASNSGFRAVIYRVVGGVRKLLASEALGTGMGAGRLRFEVVGSSLKLYRDGALVVAATDTVIKGPGLAGIRLSQTSVDNFTVLPI